MESYVGYAVEVNAGGGKAWCYIEKQLNDKTYRARLREKGTGNSIRGIFRVNKNGVTRFEPADKSRLIFAR